jgi:nuclear pore complex protein Nup107
MHLTAARMLASRVSSSDIARNKTHAILGQSMDFATLESDGENEDLTEVLDGSADNKRILKKHLLSEARSFRELEALIESLDNMETVTSMGYLLQE